MNNRRELEKFIEEIKDKVDLVEVIQKTSEYRFDTRRSGRFVKCLKPDSLVVDPDWGQYTWFAHSGSVGHQYDTGDVFTWLQKHGGKPDFWQATLWLAELYSVRVPEWKRDDNTEAAKNQKSRAAVFEIACAWFERQLWKVPAALEYAQSRGWSEETMRASRLGFSGGSFEAVNDLMSELGMHEVNLRDAATAALVGLRGNVGAWLASQGIVDGSPDWVEDDRIWGLASMPCLVYPHVWRGRVMYFSGRRLEWSSRDADELFSWGMLKEHPEKTRLIGKEKPKSYNLPGALVGERQFFFNHEFHRNADKVVVVEGPGDAISLGQLGIAAVALCGVAANKDLGKTLDKVAMKYVALDNDKAGRDALIDVAQTFGPMTRLLKWEKPDVGTGTNSPEHRGNAAADDDVEAAAYTEIEEISNVEK